MNCLAASLSLRRRDFYEHFYSLLLGATLHDNAHDLLRIPQLDERETLPIDVWLRENNLDFGGSSATVANSEAQTLLPVRNHVSTSTEVTACCDTGTNTMQLQDDDSAALATRVALEAQEKARLEEQQALMRSQFDAEVSGYQMQLSEVERVKDTQLVVQTNVIMAMLDMLLLPDDFPAFPDCSSDLLNSSNRSQLQQFLSAFQAHTELKNREQQALISRQHAMQLELDALKTQLQQMQLDALHSSALHSAASQSSMMPMPAVASVAFYSDATPSSMKEESPQDFEIFRAREEEQRLLRAEMEERLRSALLVEEEAKRERDGAMQQVAFLQQQLQDVMREVRLQHEHHGVSHPLPHLPPPPLPPPNRPAQADLGGGAAVPEPLSPKHMYCLPPCPFITRHSLLRRCSPSLHPHSCSETDSLLAKLLEMGYEPQQASVRARSHLRSSLPLHISLVCRARLPPCQRRVKCRR
jgi:hypothetical protein